MGKRRKDEMEQGERIASWFSTLIPYPFSFIPFPRFAVSPFSPFSVGLVPHQPAIDVKRLAGDVARFV